VRLPWWDLTRDREQVAVLPERVVQVLPAAAGTPAAPQAQAAPNAAPAVGAPVNARPQPPAATPADPPAPADPRPVGQTVNAAGWWPWVSAALALAWLATLGLWLRARRGPGASPAPAPRRTVPVPQDPRQTLSGLHLACAAGDPRAARQALLEWSAARWPRHPPGGLSALATRLEGPARDAVVGLDRHLYGAGGAAWDGRSAWAVLEPVVSAPPERTPQGSGRDTLPDLYPEGV
jgi:hypothetical protein